MAERAYGGEIEIVASDAIISLLIAQNARHKNLSHVCSELLTHGEDTNEIYVRRKPKGAVPGLFSPMMRSWC